MTPNMSLVQCTQKMTCQGKLRSIFLEDVLGVDSDYFGTSDSEIGLEISLWLMQKSKHAEIIC